MLTEVELNFIGELFQMWLTAFVYLRCWNKCRVLLFKRNRYCLEDYFLFNLNECQESAQKTNKQRLFVVMAANKIKSGVSGIWTERARKLYAFSCCLIFSLWKLIERKNCADKIYVYRFSCDRYALYCGLVDGKTSEEKITLCFKQTATVCDLNEWHLFIPCHWLISHCFCFIIKISRSHHSFQL